jgi:predicted nucleic acid-binding protein
VERFAVLPLLVPDRADHVEAAELRTACRRRGVQVGTIDALLAQLCRRHGLVMLSYSAAAIRRSPNESMSY